MDPLTRVLSQVLHTHSLSSGLIYPSSKLNTFSNTSLLAFVYSSITRNNTFPVHHSMATCTHKIRSKLNFMLKHQNSIFYCHSALSQFSHIIFIACFSLQHFTMRFIGSHARQTCSVLLSSLCSLLTRFRRSHTFFIDSPLLSSLCSLLTRFRRSRAHHTCSVLLSSLCNLLTRFRHSCSSYVFCSALVSL